MLTSGNGQQYVDGRQKASSRAIWFIGRISGYMTEWLPSGGRVMGGGRAEGNGDERTNLSSS